MEYSGFNFCCAVTEIGEFRDFREFRGFNEASGEARAATLKEAATELKREIKVIFNQESGYFVATTIPQQKHAILALKQLRFSKLRSFRGSSGNTVTLWGKFHK